MNRSFYIYTHSRLDDGVPFYVGKGRNRRAYSKFGRSQFWNNIVNKHGFLIEIISENLTEKEAFLHEKRLISFYGRRASGTGPLINLTDGGEGATGFTGHQNWKARGQDSEETRRKKRESHKGKKRPEHSQMMKAFFKSGKARYKIQGRPHGYKQKEETKEKLRKANLGKKQSEEVRAKMSEAQYRRWSNYKAA